MLRLKTILYLVVMTLCVLPCSGQEKPRDLRREITSLVNLLLEHHVSPRKIDDSLSKDIFHKLLHDLDPDKVFFTEMELAVLRPYEYKIDEDVNGKDTGFSRALKEQYRIGLQRSERIGSELFSSGLDWDKREAYDPNPEWSRDDEELLVRHRQLLKHHVLDRLVELSQRDSTLAPGFFETNLPQAMKHANALFRRPITRWLENPALYENQMSDIYLQAIAGVFDPHSTYFSTSDYNEFVGSLSADDYFFGFVLETDNSGNVIIGSLAPGGAAWKSGALHVSDIIVALKWQNEERIDVTGMSVEDVSDLLDGRNTELLEMTVRKVDGTEKSVMLRKEKLESDQNIVQSFILDGDIRVGYVYLPDFYTQWDEETEGARCADDVAREIFKLKREGIDGVVMDLRFNGGGSLQEARAMAGIFIDEGPLVIFSTRGQKPVSLKDMNRGTVYDGPLVIMVNGASASASEVFAAAIQDYNRGLIVGSATYGKATGQNIFPIGEITPQSGPSGFAKITTQKLFRITGKSAQSHGVYPDIPLPDVFRTLGMSEANYPFALQRDSVAGNSYYRPFAPFKVKALQAMSHERVSKNRSFQDLNKAIQSLEELMHEQDKPQPLDWKHYYQSVAKERDQRKSANDAKAIDGIFKVVNDSGKQQRLAVDEYARHLNGEWLKALSTDLFVQEAYLVMRDYITLTKRPR